MTTIGHRGRYVARGLALGAILTASLAGSAGQSMAHAEHGHPARIHEGTCEALGKVAFRLNGVGGSVDLDNAPVELPAEVNPDTAYQVMTSETTIDGSLDGLLASEHAIMVYESDDAMTAISCGNLGGAMSGDALITGLAEAGIPGTSVSQSSRPMVIGLASRSFLAMPWRRSPPPALPITSMPRTRRPTTRVKMPRKMMQPVRTIMALKPRQMPSFAGSRPRFPGPRL